jgi:hypothetical protein
MRACKKQRLPEAQKALQFFENEVYTLSGQGDEAE